MIKAQTPADLAWILVCSPSQACFRPLSVRAKRVVVLSITALRNFGERRSDSTQLGEHEAEEDLKALPYATRE